MRLSEGGGFKVPSQQRRAIRAALEAAAPHILAEAKAEAWVEAMQYADDQGYLIVHADSVSNPYRSQA
jgi:hypothetical protein